MNIFDKLRGKRKGAEEELEVESQVRCVYSSANFKEDRSDKLTYQGIGQTTYASGQPPQIYTSPLNAFKSYPVVYGCVTAISDAISSLGIKVYKIKGGEKVEDTGHIFHDLFRNPNPYQSSQEWLEQIVQSLLLFGNCFISIEGSGKAIELYVLGTQRVAIIPDATKKVKEYRYVVNGVSVAYKPEEVIHIRYSNPEDPYFGLPPLSSATEVLNLENNRLKFASAFFKNAAIPPAVLQTEGHMAETTIARLRGDWERMHRGTSNFGRVAILTGGLKFTPLTSPLKDLDLDKLKQLSSSDILTIYRTPPTVLGDMKDVSGEEGKSSLTMWWRNSLTPQVKRIETALNKGLKDIVFNGSKYYFEFNLKEVAALQDDKKEIADYIETLMGCSVMKPNEARAIIGLPKEADPNADKLFVSNAYYGNALIPADQMGQQGAGSNTPKPAATPTGNPAAKPKPAKKELEEIFERLKKLS